MKYDELMRFHTQNEKNFEELREAYSRDIIVPFVGSGLCVPPYNTWGNSLKSICSNVPSALPELERLLETGEYERAANHVFDALEIARFTKAFSEEFSPEKIHAVGLSPSMEILSEIFTGLVVTTNYDRCLEVSYEKMKRGFNSVFCIRDTSGYQHVIDQMLRNQPHYLLKIHGDIYNQSSRVLLESEYEELYAENGPFIKMLSQFFLYKQFLFLGCSMTGKDRYMRVLKQVANKHEVPSFAILPTLKKKKKESKAQYKARVEEWEAILSEHWILPVFYPDGDYESVTELLINLKTTSQLNSGKRAIHETGFFGRTDLVRDIQKQLMQSHYMIIHGVGGIGKTQICEEIVSQFPGDSVKVYLQGATGFSTLLQSVCNALGLNL